MLISRISEEKTEGAGEGRGREEEGISTEFQTASELFELMTKNQRFKDNDEDSLSTQDLVLLYKNIDIGTQLMTDANVVRRKPNQHVETIVYNGESDSDISENYSNEDIHNVFKLNQERLNIFDDGSFDNILCHKIGGLEIQSDIAADYNRQFLFKDPFIKEQLKNLDVMTGINEFGTLPTSLLDYICCKRLEDNYNFYMDNIIRYVQHTIEQLKRISNGDFLTDRVKEKWEEVNKKGNTENSNTKVLATSISIPLNIECKKKGSATWDDIVHSEVDVRSLSKILEKKIIVEIPKLLCGSYSLYSKRCADNLIISCTRDKQKESEESRVDVVLQLQRSQTGKVISNISSIMILQTTPAVQDLRAPELLPIAYKVKHNNETVENKNSVSKTDIVTVVECTDDDNESCVEIDTRAIIEDVVTDIIEYHDSLNDSNIETNGYPFSDNESISHDNPSNQCSTDTSVAFRDNSDRFQPRTEATFNLISPDELRVTMQRLHMQSSVPEESAEEVSINVSCKKKSPTRLRIKSPYENKSIIMEEKKRKRLLEIREKREKKKQALGENAKISKHKFGKGAIMPQVSSSVTKLSITNKSFYNSIYGQNVNIDNKEHKTRPRKGLRKDLIIEVPVEQIQEEYNESPNLTPEKNSQKYINRSYYLDDTETEVMFLQMKHDESQGAKNESSASTSAVSKEFSANLTLLSQLIGPSDTEKEETDDDLLQDRVNYILYNNNDAGYLHDSPTEINKVPKNSPKELNGFDDENDPKKVPITVECRKSIDKLYHLVKKLGKVPTTDSKTTISKYNLRTVAKHDAATGGSTIQGSDSGTSVKHHLTSSNPSCFSFEKVNAENPNSKVTRKKTEQTATVVPKVIISSKLQAQKVETDKLKKDRKKVTNPPPKTVPENPLKAISQLLHVFDNVQKTREKNIPDSKPTKKTEINPADAKTVLSRQGSFRRRSRLDHHLIENDQEKKVTTPTPREKRLKPLNPIEIAKIPHQHTHTEEKHIDKFAKKKIADIIDEAKEARGEAVRGPAKSSRLNSLAQPKRSYVQAHSEELQLRYGRNLIADRLQRLAKEAPSAVIEHTVRNVGSPKNKVKRESTSSNVSAKQLPPSVRPLDKTESRQRSASSSPNRKRSPTPALSTSSQKHTVSDTPEIMKKMVAVNSYVTSHYGQTATPLPGELLLAGHKSRVPLVPNDIELTSLSSSPAIAEANELGSTLHRIIDSMITPPLAALSEDYEPPFKLSEKNSERSVDNVFRDQRTESDYSFDVLEDNNLKTAVENVHRDKATLGDIFGKSAHKVQSFSSTMELEKLENALYNQISGTFQKRLRIKKLTLTPKQSMQQVFLLQSGDAGSLLVKSVSSLKINKCDAGSYNDVKAVPVLSNSHLNWKFAQIPMQIATVGYAYPHYQPGPSPSTLNVKSLTSGTVISEHGSGKICKSDKISQCFKGTHQEPQTAKFVQVEVHEHEKKVSKAKNTCTSIMTEIAKEPINVTEVKELPENKGKNINTNCTDNESVENPGKPIKEDTDTIVTSSPDNVDYTTSLDMLVGLLNEIQKITCEKPGKSDLICTELENVLVSAAARENSPDPLSITSLDKLRQLESNPSIYSFYISSDSNPSSEHVVTEPKKLIFLDKEVNVNLCEKECVNNFTDVPSKVLPITVNRSTSVTNSVIGIISEPSTQSMVSFNDFNTLYSNTFFNCNSIKRIIDLPQIESNDKIKGTGKKTDLNEKCYETFTFDITREQDTIVPYKMEDCPVHFESTIKFKRHVLVTVYSILVFTVFAALSFPDMAIFEG